ncbi:hypothetical protein NIES4071_52760 [Calothrix sp. NIES-4071]|nr:hypothetical protein NIES4071_52760 [Calothrix sp. NIES-4071]BAZ59584.1 hypothetical protein NIES4105_52710 [Calothrix sp. NIES-4105]
MTVASDKISTINSNEKIAQLLSLLTNLNNKIRNFSVIDRQSNLIGTIKDVIIDSNRQISFIVYDDYQGRNRLFLLKGQLVQKIDPLVKKIFLIIDNSKINDLPEYLEREMEENTNVQDSIYDYNQDNHAVDSHIASGEQELDTQLTNLRSEEIIKLLEERLVVERSKRKIGEIIVRKEIETRMVTVPVRRERLIVEQVSPEHKELANVDLGEQVGEVESDVELPVKAQVESSKQLPTTTFEGSLTVTGEFSSPKVASLLLNAIALERNHGCQRIQVTIAVENEQLQQKYQEWFSRTSIRNSENNSSGK